MPYLKSLVISLALLSLIDAALQAQTNLKPQKEGTATVSGRVLLKGEPVRGVVVMMQPQQEFGPSSKNSQLRTKTNSDGSFTIAAVPAGRYFITAATPAYVATHGNEFDIRGQALNISEGERIENIEFSLGLGGVITGRVTGSNGRPLVDQPVQLWRIFEQGPPRQYNASRNYQMFRTDDRGVYRLFGLPAGRYLISVGYAQRDDGFRTGFGPTYYAETYHPDVADQKQAKILELAEGEELTNVDVAVGEAKKTYSLYGRVVDSETGAPIIGMVISYGIYLSQGRGVSGWGGRGERTDARGEFQLQGIQPGKFAAFAVPDENSDFYSETTPFEIAESDIHGVEIRVKRGGSISGFVVVEGANDPSVAGKISQLRLSGSVRAPGGNMPRPNGGVINPDGSFRLNGLRAGKVMIAVYSTRGERNFSVLRVERNGAPQRDGIEVGEGEQIRQVRVVLGYGSGLVRGQLKVIGGQLPTQARFFVNAERVGEPRNSNYGAQVDARGQFFIEGMLPGEYQLRVHLSSNINPPDEMRKLQARLVKIRQPVSVHGGEVQVELVVDLTPEGDEK